MTSDDIKKLMLKRCSFSNGYMGAVTEATNCNAADVIGVKFGARVQEFEIKVSRSDLIGEMRCARVAAGLLNLEQFIKKDIQLNLETDGIERTPEQIQMIKDRGHSLSKTKLEKHRFYLDKTHYQKPYAWGAQPKKFVPHTFYWCIPYSLLEVCREYNAGLPYGIYVYDMPQRSIYERKYIVTPARSLGGQGDGLYMDLFNRACTEWADDRHRVAYLEEKIKSLDINITD